MPDLKLKFARHQLGTSLALFLVNDDPVSVHVLACSAGEVLRGICKHEGKENSFNQLVRESEIIDDNNLHKIMNQSYNSFKHYFERDYATPRQDDETLQKFSDTHNEGILYAAWHDYSLITEALPIEAQVFQLWMLLKERMIRGNKKWTTIIPSINKLAYLQISREEMKKNMRDVIAAAKLHEALLNEPNTERQPLILGL